MSYDLIIEKVRRIAKHGVDTPLLVPSFSSRGFPNISTIMQILRVEISNVCLLSAFDIARGYTSIAFEDIADVVIIDSGVYETTPATIAVDAFLPACTSNDWTREEYRGFLEKSASRMANTNVLSVSFDAYCSIDEQLEQAREDFKLVPNAATDFLLKPEMSSNSYGSFLRLGSKLNGFDVIGVTERELGKSAIERCRAILELRTTLDEAGLPTPIDGFGSITPAAVTSYFLSRADIFYGLNWLRVGLDNLWAGAPSEFAVTHALFEFDDDHVMLELWQRNIKILQRTQHALRRFTDDGDKNALVTTLPFAIHSLKLAEVAKKNFERR